MKLKLLYCAAMLFFGGILHGSAQTPAFPGALGFGANATGGRGGTIYHVTTLADSGAGSFRDAVSHSGRIIVFDVGGYISLSSAVSCAGNLTIAGQTAPGGGIGFKGGEISFASRSNIICRYVRIRPGSDTASTSDDALSLYRAQNIICDHVSLEFGPWNNIDAVSDNWQTNPVTKVTFQNCLDANPTGQQFGAHTESVSSSMSWFGCIFANSHNRNPLSKINDVFINNVDYNCSMGYTTHTSTSFSHDIVNNYFIAGPAYSSSSDFPWYQVDNNQSIYYSGNLFDGNSDGALNGSVTTPYWYQGGGTVLASPWSSVTASAPVYSTAAAYRITVSQAGALPRDQIDALVISQVKTLGNAPTGTGAGTAGPDSTLYDSQTQTGLGNNGYGAIAGGIAPADSDGDGMPDYWEKAVGLNYLSASDAMTIASDGYANIEHYLNWLADPHAQTVTNTAVDMDLWQYTSGFTNAAPVYSTANASNGVVTLNSGHVARFTPATDFSGLGSFQFSVRASDGSAYTNIVAVLVTPQTQAAARNLVWRGDGISNLWAVAAGTNWDDGTNLVAFNSGDSVTFDDRGSNAPAIALSGMLSPASISVLADQDYTFTGSGALAGPATLFKVGAGTLFINTTNTFNGGVTIAEGTIQLGDGISATGNLAGNITNNDTLIFNNPAALSSSAGISGSGVLIKNGAGALTLTGAQTYTNQTVINSGALQFSGAIPPGDITNNGALIFAPGGFTIYSNAISGSGSLTASGSVKILSGANTFGGDVTNSSGFLILSNNAAAGSGTVVYNGGYVVVASGITITNDFYVPGSSASDLNMMATNSGTATWAGNVTVGGSAQWRPGSDGGTLMFLGAAAMGSHILVAPRGSVIFASNAAVSSTVSGFLGRDSSGHKRSLNLAIRDNASVSMAGCSFGGGKTGGSITITLQNNGALSFGASTVDLLNIANAAAVSTLRLNGGMLTAGGFAKTKTFEINVINFNGGVLQAGGDNAAFLPAFSTSTNIVQSGGAIIDDGGFAITIAAPLIHDPALGSSADGGLTKLGAGALTLTSGESYTGPTVISAGTLALSGRGLMPASSIIQIAADAILSADVAMNVLNGQTLGGDGLLAGNIYCGLGARLSPGSNSIGALTFSNSLSLLAGSTNLFEISRDPLTNDSVKVFGSLTLGGTLVVTNISGTQLAAGDNFKLFDAAACSGAFSSVVLPALPAGLAWNTDSLNTSGTISVVLAAAPVIGSISVSGDQLVLSGAGGVANADFYLLASTNLALPLSEWTIVATNGFDAGGGFSFTNTPGSNSAQTFYRLQLQ